MNKDIPQWVQSGAAIIIAVISAGMGLAAYAFTNFETKTEATELKSDITQRLDRIENKIDKLISKE